MRVADYIVNYLYENVADTLFMVVGGGSMFLNDAIRKHGKMKYICCHHEQAAAMAASGYARATGKPGVCNVTTGCGSTNALTGVLGAWQDRIPMIIISGQTKRRETIAQAGTRIPIRQMGVQEADIIPIVKPITKYSIVVTDPNEIKQILDFVCWTMRNPPTGPVWIDVPLDIQGVQIDFDKLASYPLPKEQPPDYSNVSLLLNMLQSCKRPIIIAGHGIRLDDSLVSFRNFVESYNIPVVFSRLGIDVLPYDHPLHIGRIGTKGDRAGNFTVQNADLVISMGSRLSVSTIGQEYNLFARDAKKVVIDVDPNEHEKKTIKIDLFLRGRISKFLETLNILYMSVNFHDWAEKCLYWKKKWPVFQPEHLNSEKVNLYYFIDKLSEKLQENAVVIGDAGSAMFVTGQGFKNKEGQILILSGGQAEMGFTVPACVGASVAKGEVIGIVGDGSFQMNIQELQTIVHHKLPIKLFVWNNEGYLSIRNTQKKFFGGNFIGCDPEIGDISFPSLEKIAEAYGIKYFKCDTKSLDQVMNDVLAFKGPAICEVLCLKNQDILTVSSIEKNGVMVSRPLEDMYPFLPREEFLQEMIVKPTEASK